MTVGLALVTLTFVLASARWIVVDRAPPLWDSAYYLEQSLVLDRALEHGGVSAFLDAFSSSMPAKAPLVAALPIPFFRALGESHDAARFVNLAWMIVCAIALERIGRRVSGPTAGVVAVALLNLFPLVAGMSRQFLVEYGLMSLVVLWMDQLFRWIRSRGRAVPLVLGVLLGFGLLLKASFPLYVAAPTLLALRFRARDGVRHSRIAGDCAAIAAVALPIAATWYARNLAGVIGFVFDAGFGEAGRPYGTGPVFSPATIADYWTRLVNSGISLWFAALLALFAARALRPRLGDASREPAEGTSGTGVRRGIAADDRALLHAWWIVPFLALTFATNKDPRYAIAYLPAIALLLAAGLSSVASGRSRAVVTGLALVPAVLLFSATTFGRPRIDPAWRAGPFVVAASTLAWAHPPDPVAWPSADVVRRIGEDAAATPGDKIRVRVLFSHPSLNAHLLNSESTRIESRVRFTTVHFQVPDSEAELVDGINSGYDYVLAKSGSPGPERLNARNLEMAAALADGRLRFDRVAAIALPDGSEVAIFRRRR